MSGQRKGPRARDRILGARLRAIRKGRTELTLEEAAAAAQWSPSTMSRIETGKRHIAPEDVATLATLYELPLKERQELIEVARTGNESGGWDVVSAPRHLDMMTIASYEAEAIRITDWSVNVVPGLLQTRGYAVGLMRLGRVPAEEIEARWQARLRRQQILGTVDYAAYLGEAALRTPFGGPEVLREQLRHLLAAPVRGIPIRVVPEHRPHLVVLHSWLLMEFANTTPVVNVEARGGSVFLHDEVAQLYLALLDQLDGIALSKAASMALVRAVLENSERAQVPPARAHVTGYPLHRNLA